MRRIIERGVVSGSVLKFFLGLILLGSLAWMYRSSLLAPPLETTIARLGKIEHNLTIMGVFANEEALIHAPATGTPDYLGKEGQRFRKGDIVAMLKPEGIAVGSSSGQASLPVYAPTGGVLCHETDGLEGVITPENLMAMELSKVLNQSNQTKKTDTVVQTGGVIGKIVNNLRPTVAVIKIPPGEAVKVGMLLKFKKEQHTLNAKVVRVVNEPPSIVIQFFEHIEGTEKQRLQEISWIERSSSQGIVLPKSCLWTKGEEQGVFVVQEGIIQFRKILIADEDENFICIPEKVLPQGIPIISNPQADIEGKNIKVKLAS